MADIFENSSAGLLTPVEQQCTTATTGIAGRQCYQFNNTTKQLWVGGAGDVYVYNRTKNSWMLFEGVPAGTSLFIRADAITTGLPTTATKVAGFY